MKGLNKEKVNCVGVIMLEIQFVKTISRAEETHRKTQFIISALNISFLRGIRR